MKNIMVYDDTAAMIWDIAERQCLTTAEFVEEILDFWRENKKAESMDDLNGEKPLRVCDHCLAGIECHEGKQRTLQIFCDADDEEESRCDWCEESGFDTLYIIG